MPLIAKTTIITKNAIDNLEIDKCPEVVHLTTWTHEGCKLSDRRAWIPPSPYPGKVQVKDYTRNTHKIPIPVNIETPLIQIENYPKTCVHINAIQRYNGIMMV